MITVSTSESPARAYHHGDLRTALVEAGLTALETTAIGDLSLRQLARDVGVSATAVYRHFPDKQALLGALAQAGLDQLGQAQQAAAAATSADDMFAATGRAYVRWALDHPALFRLVFGQCHRVGEAVFGENTAAHLLRSQVASYSAADADTQRLMIQAWAVVHGLAMLMLDGQLPRDEALIERIINPRKLFALKG